MVVTLLALLWRLLTRLLVRVNRLTGGVVPPPPHYGEPKDGGWNVLLVHAHPRKDSFCAALAEAAADAMRSAGHQVRVLSLHSCSDGEPLRAHLSAAEHGAYSTRRQLSRTDSSYYPPPAADVAPLVEAVCRADALVLCYPTWWMGFPAVLKGFFDRVLLPGVAFGLPCEGRRASPIGLVPKLQHIQKVGVVSTYGCSRAVVGSCGDGARALITRYLLHLLHPRCTVSWHGLYAIDSTSAEERARFVSSVRASYATFCPPPRSAAGPPQPSPGDGRHAHRD